MGQIISKNSWMRDSHRVAHIPSRPYLATSPMPWESRHSKAEEAEEASGGSPTPGSSHSALALTRPHVSWVATA